MSNSHQIELQVRCQSENYVNIIVAENNQILFDSVGGPVPFGGDMIGLYYKFCMNKVLNVSIVAAEEANVKSHTFSLAGQ